MAHTPEFDKVHIRQGRQIIADTLTIFSQHCFSGIPKQRYPNDLFAHLLFTDNGAFGIVGECDNGIYPGFDIIDHIGHIVAVGDLDSDLAAALTSLAANMLDALEVIDRLFDTHHNLFFHFPRPGTGVGHGDID